ncbi:hypothetical protein [Hoylesella timonensis]|uniref:Uncharacterized protein n=1 Tax=Hoylesella timonensis S9-PR14 TaxID=1401062 RepID=A0A098YQD5_9BACT|nr:hypothetical protein [Hoylesella timonensis]KGI20843.1 hypothetical protein HMPREF9304_13745 [Hoylesella timonensis S9-PR14]
MNTTEDNTSNVALCNSDDNGQRRGEAPNKMYSPRLCAADVTSKDGAKPQQEYSPEQRSG